MFVTYVGDDFRLCFDGFDRASPLDVTIRTPSGRTLRRRVIPHPDEPGPSLSQNPMPGVELGAYRAIAAQGNPRQGRLTARATWHVRLAPGPAIRVHETGRDHRKVSIIVVGMRPRQRVALHFYRKREPHYTSDYITSIGLRADRRGELLYRVGVAHPEPIGCYVVLPSFEVPHETPGLNFCLARP
jgi:hypothetical protein